MALLGGTALLAVMGCSESEDLGQGVPDLHLEEIARFGSLDGDGPALSEVVGVALTDSTVLILESRPPRIAVFDHDGEWLRDLGRSGDGPGEFRSPVEIGIFDGNVWVGDLSGLRLEVLSQDGTSVASYRWDIPGDSLNDLAVPTAMLADGSVLATPHRIISATLRHRPYYRVAPNGEVLELLYRQAIAEGDMFTATFAGGRLAVGPHPLPESPVVDVFPNGQGLVAVERTQAGRPDSASFSVEVIGTKAETAKEFEVPYTPLPATGWLDDFGQRIEDEMQGAGAVDNAQIAAVQESLAPRSFYPPVSGVVGGSDGSIWIRKEEPLLADSVRWQVLDPDGNTVGTFMAPTDLQILLPSLDEVWAVEPAEFDVPSVVRLRVGP